MGRRSYCGQPLREDHARPNTTGIYLNGNDVLKLILKGLCLSEDQPGYLSCRHCLNKKSQRNKTFPTSVGVVDHFSRGSFHTPNSFLAEQLPQTKATADAPPPPVPCPPQQSAPGHLGPTPSSNLAPAKRPSPASSTEGPGPPCLTPLPLLESRQDRLRLQRHRNPLPLPGGATPCHAAAYLASTQEPSVVPSPDPSGYKPPKPDQPPVNEAPTPPAKPPSLFEEQGLVAALKSHEVQEWLRVLCRMHVLTQQMLLGGLEYDELLPLWAKRMKILHAPPPLFESIKLAVSEKGVTWQTILTAKLVAGETGFVAVATGGDTYAVLDRGSRLQGALSALFGLARCGITRRFETWLRIAIGSC